MRRLPFTLLPLAALILPAGVFAQTDAAEDAPPTLRLSVFMCDSNRLDEVMEELAATDLPVWKELVAEGMVENHGYYRHAWADEWNLGIYTIGSSVDAVIKASAEAGRRLEERYGDAPNAFGAACPHHRDGFYELGPSATQ